MAYTSQPAHRLIISFKAQKIQFFQNVTLMSKFFLKSDSLEENVVPPAMVTTKKQQVHLKLYKINVTLVDTILTPFNAQCETN